MLRKDSGDLDGLGSSELEGLSSPEMRNQSPYLRRNSTDAEHVLWQFLRARRLGHLKFRRQHTIGRYILDFYCHEARLVVEVDGPVHSQRKEQDAERDRWLRAAGLTVLRINNEDIFLSLKEVLTSILLHTPSSPTGEEGRGVEGPK